MYIYIGIHLYLFIYVYFSYCFVLAPLKWEDMKWNTTAIGGRVLVSKRYGEARTTREWSRAYYDVVLSCAITSVGQQNDRLAGWLTAWPPSLLTIVPHRNFSLSKFVLTNVSCACAVCVNALIFCSIFLRINSKCESIYVPCFRARINDLNEFCVSESSSIRPLLIIDKCLRSPLVPF